MAPMVDLGTYEFTYFKTVNITPDELFINVYTDEVYELEQVHTSTK